jgi:hypothetical protein
LEEVHPHGIFNINVAIVLEDEPSNVRDNELFVFLATAMFEISYKKEKGVRDSFPNCNGEHKPRSLKDESALTSLGYPY